jgi:NhaA family Na+:H+ antiporter
MPRDRDTAQPDPASKGLLQRFLESSAASSSVLLVAVAVALMWANSRWADGYERLWTTPLTLHVGGTSVGTDLRFWVSDGLMTIFFLLVGMEIDRELRSGELRQPRVVVLPALAAVGGMVVPALIFLAVVGGGPAARGWGIPMATDIALALGVLGLAARYTSPDARPLLLTLAIVDDIGSIVVVTIFYATGGAPLALVAAAAVVAAIVVAERMRVHLLIVPIVLGAALWYAFLRAGIEPAIAGVVVGVLTPPESIGRFERVLLVWTGFVIVPLFALANAGVRLDTSTLFVGAGGAVALGIVLARVVGKPLGVVAAARLGVATGVSRLPDGAGWGSILGLGVTAGLGFTVSLFIAELAFHDDRVLLDAAKVGIMVSAVLAGVASYVTFRVEHAALRRRGTSRGT